MLEFVPIELAGIALELSASGIHYPQIRFLRLLRS